MYIFFLLIIINNYNIINYIFINKLFWNIYIYILINKYIMEKKKQIFIYYFTWIYR